MNPVYSVRQIQQAEQPLLASEKYADQLMRSAAASVATAAHVMLERKPVIPVQTKVLLAVGGGGNGGDTLYAGAELAEAGWRVEAVLLGSASRVHQRALDAFTAVGGTVVELTDLWKTPPRYRLVVDGILGLGGKGGLRPEAATVMAFLRQWLVPVLAVDIPSGIEADSGATPGAVDIDDPPDPRAGKSIPTNVGLLGASQVAAHVIADVTVTFGGLRRAHAVSAYCGQVVVADPGISGTRPDDVPMTISSQLNDQRAGNDGVQIQTAVAFRPERQANATGGLDMGGPYNFSDTDLAPIRRARYGGPREPGPYDDKYAGGVVGICAGSDLYPGAGVLTTTAAVRTTSSMVRYVGSGGQEVVRACPEVIVSRSVEETGRVQAWVVGPGRGTDDGAAAELATLLGRREPLVIDADAITLLAERKELREALARRSDRSLDAPTALLTPHVGEFRRLASAVMDGDSAESDPIPDVGEDRIGAAVAVAERLNCGVLLKGRHTVIVDRPITYSHGREPDTSVHTIDAGTSWGATPGAGDVLAGMLGAAMAESQALLGNADHAAPGIVAVHATAAALSAKVGDSYAPTSSSRIAEAIPLAWTRTGSTITDRGRGMSRSPYPS